MKHRGRPPGAGERPLRQSGEEQATALAWDEREALGLRRADRGAQVFL